VLCSGLNPITELNKLVIISSRTPKPAGMNGIRKPPIQPNAKIGAQENINEIIFFLSTLKGEISWIVINITMPHISQWKKYIERVTHHVLKSILLTGIKNLLHLQVRFITKLELL
jgi:hypothetical protein